MKNRTRIILVLALVIMSICLLAIVSSATEYEASTKEEFNSAFSSAVDGDTIIIKSSISATLDFGKSITYILDGDGIVWTAGAQNTATGKDVKICSRNGDNSFKPNSAMWCNSYGLTVNDLKSTSWTLEALDTNSTIMLDLSSVTTRLFYGTNLKELNLKYGTHVTKCNNTKSDNTFYLYSTTINMYEGAKIYGNYTQPYRGFMQTQVFNMYGGEIYGNYFGEYGMVIAISGTPTVNMYGGKIHDTYLSFGNGGVTEGIFNNASLNMYGGEIFGNYIKGSDASKHSILAGNKQIINGSVYENYYVTSWTAPTYGENGLWSTEIDKASATMLGNGVGSTALNDYSIIFKNANSSVIDAFMIKDGVVKKSVSGATEITVPSDIVAWTTKANYCEPIVLPQEFTQGAIYYVMIDHKATDDFDCTTELLCDACKTVLMEAKEHSESVVITYGDFTLTGSKLITCKNEGCNHSKESTPKALIEYLGVSAKMNEGSFCIGYILNSKEANEYINAGNTFKFGVVAYIPENESDLDPIDSNLLPKEEEYTISAELQANIDGFDFVLRGFTADAYETELIMCAYVYDGDDVDYISIEDKTAIQTDLATVIKFSDYIQEVKE